MTLLSVTKNFQDMLIKFMKQEISIVLQLGKDNNATDSPGKAGKNVAFISVNLALVACADKLIEAAFTV